MRAKVGASVSGSKRKMTSDGASQSVLPLTMNKDDLKVFSSDDMRFLFGPIGAKFIGKNLDDFVAASAREESSRVQKMDIKDGNKDSKRQRVEQEEDAADLATEDAAGSAGAAAGAGARAASGAAASAGAAAAASAGAAPPS